MKWGTIATHDGDHRLAKRFLFLPVSLDGQTRWLERVTIYQTFDGGKKRWVNKHWPEALKGKYNMLCEPCWKSHGSKYLEGRCLVCDADLYGQSNSKERAA